MNPFPRAGKKQDRLIRILEHSIEFLITRVKASLHKTFSPAL